ncbi:methyltransferase domain-containing protein [Zhaonella formicivorans]|uniref:methyltransferase domain-containing protein n=1 Tax=Zhaonella formicivorans TaxID=2528593 RepID=UPI0010EF17CE|nr:methyltransferase domain-containing protein [Zhaonella formicivorans]
MVSEQAIREAIIARYTAEAGLEGCLSCGTVLNDALVKSGETVLDLGCGKGYDVINAARLTGEEGKVYGLDLTPAMLEAARANARKESVANVEFIQAALEEIPLPDASIDLVISNCTINHSLNKLQAYREIYRVLKPGGRFVISDVMAEEPLPPEVVQDPQAWAECYGGALPAAAYYDLIKMAGFLHIYTLKSRSYLKNGHKMTSRTLHAFKPGE